MINRKLQFLVPTMAVMALVLAACAARATDPPAQATSTTEPPTRSANTQTPEQPTSTSVQAQLDEQAALSVVYQSIDALNAEDATGYMATIHPQSKFQRQEYVASLHDGFQVFNLRHEILEIEVEYVRTDEARVAFVMFVDFNSPDFQNTKITGAYILKPHEGRWMLYDDVIKMVETQG